MSKTRIFAIITVVFMLICILTNPSKEKFEDVITQKATSIIKQQLQLEDDAAMDLAMSLYGNAIVKQVVSDNIIIKNYYLFTVVKIKWQSEEQTIGGGAIQTVWLSPEIDKKIDEIIGVLKSL